MKASKISYVRNHLSEVLSCVKEGETVLVLDRENPGAPPKYGPPLKLDSPIDLSRYILEDREGLSSGSCPTVFTRDPRLLEAAAKEGFRTDL